jgi:hypothetical protein
MQGKPVGSLQIGEAAALKLVRDGKETSAPAPYVEFSLQSTPQKDGQNPAGVRP